MSVLGAEHAVSSEVVLDPGESVVLAITSTDHIGTAVLEQRVGTSGWQPIAQWTSSTTTTFRNDTATLMVVRLRAAAFTPVQTVALDDVPDEGSLILDLGGTAVACTYVQGAAELQTAVRLKTGYEGSTVTGTFAAGPFVFTFLTTAGLPVAVDVPAMTDNSSTTKTSAVANVITITERDIDYTLIEVAGDDVVETIYRDRHGTVVLALKDDGKVHVSGALIQAAGESQIGGDLPADVHTEWDGYGTLFVGPVNGYSQVVLAVPGPGRTYGWSCYVYNGTAAVPTATVSTDYLYTDRHFFHDGSTFKQAVSSYITQVGTWAANKVDKNWRQELIGLTRNLTLKWDTLTAALTGAASAGAVPDLGTVAEPWGAVVLGDGSNGVAEYVKEVTIVAADVVATGAGKFGHADGYPLVANPGADVAVEFVSARMVSDFDTAAYTAGGNITVNENGGTARTGLISAASSVGAGADTINIFRPLTAAAETLTANKGLNLVSSAAFTDPGTAVGVIRVQVRYRLHTLGLA